MKNLSSYEQRASIIEAIARTLAILYGGNADLWKDFEEEATAIFDAQHGLARVCPIEATEEMIAAARELRYMEPVLNQQWRLMSASGDLTNLPEKK